jgi:hypothetical protein
MNCLIFKPKFRLYFNLVPVKNHDELQKVYRDIVAKDISADAEGLEFQ